MKMSGQTWAKCWEDEQETSSNQKKKIHSGKQSWQELSCLSLAWIYIWPYNSYNLIYTVVNDKIVCWQTLEIHLYTKYTECTLRYTCYEPFPLYINKVQNLNWILYWRLPKGNILKKWVWSPERVAFVQLNHKLD